MKTSPELQKAVAEYQKGSVEAFNTLYEQSYKYLHTCVIHVVKNEDMAMDMLQETYLEISKSISQLKSTEDFLSWAAMIANRKCFAHLKKQKDILLDGSGSGDGYSDVEDNVTDYFENIADNEEFIPETVLQDREKQRLIKEIIDGLNDMQRLCVIGFYYNEQKQEEIAEELGIPVNTVKSHLNRAKAKIKEAVVELDVKKGTRLYSFAPFMALLFKEEVQACVLRPMSKGLASAVGISASGAVGSALPGGLEAVKEYITENFGETLGEIFADTIGKAAIKVKALWAKFTAASIQTKAVVATTACAVTIGGVAAVMSPQKEVVDVLSADLDIVVTEEKIISELYDIDYTYSEEEQRYECVFHLWSDEEHKYVKFDTCNIYSGIEEDCVDGFKLGDLSFKEYIREGMTESDSTYYVLPTDNDSYLSMLYYNFSEEDIKTFINCMYELKSSDNSEEYFNIKKDRMDSYLWGFGIDLEKLKNKSKKKVYYSYRFTDMCYEKQMHHYISNDGQYSNFDELNDWYLEIEEPLFTDRIENYTRFGNLDWILFLNEYKETWGWHYLRQMTSIEGTTWEMLISSNKKGTDLLDLYDYFMKNFNRKHNENVEDIVEENGQVEVKIDGEYVISEQTKEYLDLLLDIKAREAYSEIFNIDFTKYEFGANYKEKSMFWEDIPIKHVGGEGINEIVFYDGKHNKLVKDYTGFGMGINGCSYTIANFVNGKIQGQATNIYIHDVSAYNWDTWEYAYSGNYQVTEFNVQSNSIVGSVISTWYGDSFTGFDRQREQFRKYTGNVDYVDVEYDHMVMETNFGYDEEDFMRSNKKYYIYVGEVDVIRKTSMDKPDEPLPIFNYKIYLTENGAFDDLKNNIIREEEDNGAGGINYDVYIERDLDNNGYMEYEPLHVYYGYEGGYEFIIPIDIDYIK